MPAYSDMSYDKLLLDGLRVVSFEPGKGPLTNEGLVKAVTMNENLKTLGYTLSPRDIVRIAQSPSADSFYEKVKAQMSDVKAKPMYPDFPTQVMEMSEAQYRMHQLVHYFSTYGISELTGFQVEKGWLPAEEGLVSDTEKTVEDTTLLSAKTLGLVPEDEKYQYPFEHILGKRERMTNEEREIVKRCAESGKLDLGKKISVPFKENLRDTFMTVAEAGARGQIPRQDAARTLFNICQHPGDVTENLHRYLAKKRYSLRTTEKKMFVSLYDRYGDAAFKGNLIVPRSREKFTKEIFRHIGFTKYTRSPEKAKTVREIGKDRTWEAKARDMITSHDPDAIRFAAQRPGMLIRMTSMALRNGYSENEIANELLKKSCDISAQTLVSQICSARREPSLTPSVGAAKKEKALSREIQIAEKTEMFLAEKERAVRAEEESSKPLSYSIGSVWPGAGRMPAQTAYGRAEIPAGRPVRAAAGRKERLIEKRDKVREKETRRIAERNSASGSVDRIFTAVLRDRLSRVETGLEGKTVFLDEQYDLSRMDADPSKKSMDQGYLPSRTVMKIPEDVKRIRCFVYWNDIKCVDLDLHASVVTGTGEEFRVGWNSDFRRSGVVMSGDITHSNAAEYIDIDLEEAKDVVADLRLHLFSGYDGFDKVDTCYVGLMAVDRIGQDVKLYDPKNCFVSRDITNDCRAISIGALDSKNRALYFEGKEIEGYSHPVDLEALGIENPSFSLKEYLDILVEAQGGRFTDDPEKADVILTLTKPASEKEISLIDNNYFFEAKPREEQSKEIDRAEQAKEEQERAQEEAEAARRIQGRQVHDTEFVKAFVAAGGLGTAAAIFREEMKAAVIVADPKTGEVFIADRNRPGGARIEGGIVNAVMEIEKGAAVIDYARAIKLSSLRSQLKASVREAVNGPVHGHAEKEHHAHFGPGGDH